VVPMVGIRRRTRRGRAGISHHPGVCQAEVKEWLTGPFTAGCRMKAPQLASRIDTIASTG
jgi:hypothetical protein